MLVLPTETESLQLKLLGGHKRRWGGRGGGSSVSVFTLLFVNDTIDVENFVFSIKITHFLGGPQIWLNQALGSLLGRRFFDLFESKLKFLSSGSTYFVQDRPT